MRSEEKSPTRNRAQSSSLVAIYDIGGDKEIGQRVEEKILVRVAEQIKAFTFSLTTA
jgi:hypothetical protein